MKKSKLGLSKYFLFSFIIHIVVLSPVIYLIFEGRREIDSATIEIGFIDSPSGTQKDTVVKKKKSSKIAKKQSKSVTKPKQAEVNELSEQKEAKKLFDSKKLPTSNEKVENTENNSISYKSETSDKNSNLILAHPDYKYNPKPKYPMIAKRRGYEGTVLLNVYVLESGRVGELNLEKASGYSILDKSAIDSVKQWIFFPGTRDGIAVSSWVQVPIQFRLTNI